MISIIIFNSMRNDHHTIFGINGCYAVLQSNKYKIIEILIQSGSQAEKDGKITHLLGYHGGHIKILPSTQFKSNFNQWRTQGIVVRFSGRIDSDLPSYKENKGNIGLLALDGIEDQRINGTSSWDGSLRIEAKDASEGVWTLSIEMQDHAGNNRTLSTSIDIQGREATSSEMLVSFGSTYNILAISVILITGIISWISFRRVPEEIELDFVEEIELDFVEEPSED